MFSGKEPSEPASLNGGAVTTPLVDVNLVTYNHEKFVAQAIESILEQETNFEYRLLVGDDCSNDGTQAIIERYARQYPHRIMTIFEPQHLGVEHENRVGIKLLKLSTAKYLTLLDGDDFWTDPRKLQKQVDLLERHPEFSLCFHNTRIIREDGTDGPELFCLPHQKEVSTLDDLLAGNFIHSGSCMFRRGLFGELPKWFFTSRTPDWALHVMSAKHGPIAYMNEVMAAYRVHAGGSWSATAYSLQLINGIRLLDDFDEYLGFTHQKRIKETQYEYSLRLAAIYREQGDLVKARACLRRCLRLRLSTARKPEKDLRTELLELHVPFLYYPFIRFRKYLDSTYK